MHICFDKRFTMWESKSLLWGGGGTEVSFAQDLCLAHAFPQIALCWIFLNWEVFKIFAPELPSASFPNAVKFYIAYYQLPGNSFSQLKKKVSASFPEVEFECRRFC